jgi:hypothetical protein
MIHGQQNIKLWDILFKYDALNNLENKFSNDYSCRLSEKLKQNIFHLISQCREYWCYTSTHAYILKKI